jgi:hypothetical protein
MTETTQQEVQRLQQEIAQKQARIFELLYASPTSSGTVSNKMRQYMHQVSDKVQHQRQADEPYVQFPEPARPREPNPGDD